MFRSRKKSSSPQSASKSTGASPGREPGRLQRPKSAMSGLIGSKSSHSSPLHNRRRRSVLEGGGGKSHLLFSRNSAAAFELSSGPSSLPSDVEAMTLSNAAAGERLRQQPEAVDLHHSEKFHHCCHDGISSTPPQSDSSPAAGGPVETPTGSSGGGGWFRKTLIGRTPSLPSSLGKKKHSFLKVGKVYYFTYTILQRS